MSKPKTSLLIAILFISIFLLTTQLNAYKPLITIGKPELEDILYSPDGSYLATLTPAYVELLDAEIFEPVSRIDDTGGYKLAFSPDSSLLAVYDWKDGIKIWDIDSQSLIETIPIKTSTFAFSPDWKYLAYTEDDSVFLWDIAEEKIVRELTGDHQPKLKEFRTADGKIVQSQAKQRVETIAFHPNGKILAVGSLRSTIALWDVENGEITSYLKLRKRIFPKYICFNHTGNLLAVVTKDCGVGLWNIDIEDALHFRHIYHGGRASIDYHLVFTPDSEYLIGGQRNGYLVVIEVATFNYEKKPAVDSVSPPNAGTYWFKRLTFQPDGERFASLINDSRIAVWNTQNFSRIQTLYGYDQTDAQAVYLPKIDRIVTGTYTNVLHFWNATNGELLETVEFYTTIWQLKASPDGQKFAIDVEATNQVWDAETIKPLHVFRVGGYLATKSIVFSPSGKYFASNGCGGTRIWDTETGEKINQIDSGWSDFSLLMFTPDEQQILLIPPDEEKVVFWDIETGERVREISNPGIMVNWNGSFIQARENKENIEVFQIDPIRRFSRIPKPELSNRLDRFSPEQFHPDGTVLVIYYRDYEDQTEGYRFYNPHTGLLISTLPDIQDLRIVGNGDYMFITDNKYQLGLYITSHVLDVKPLDMKLTLFAKIKQNQLFQNYPNPFNPETWIPFRLAEDAQVSIRIYSSLGQLVRDFDLGRLSAGEYVDKDKAVYWDGRNKDGEEVSSGVYFYQIQAGEWSETKKMVIIR